MTKEYEFYDTKEYQHLAELVDYMGTDLTVVNAARVSFNKQSDWEYELDQLYSKEGQVYIDGKRLSDKDIGLIKYLAKHNHFTPFTHVVITMRETVPIFTARQRFKHMVGFTYNEVSRRYDDSDPEFYYPDGWRLKAENVKQGSSSDISPKDVYWDKRYEQHIENSAMLYRAMLDDDIAPEQARMVLPQSMFTSYYVTGSLFAWARAFNLRIDGHAQREIQDLAKQWDTVIGGLDVLKNSWKALTKEHNGKGATTQAVPVKNTEKQEEVQPKITDDEFGIV